MHASSVRKLALGTWQIHLSVRGASLLAVLEDHSLPGHGTTFLKGERAFATAPTQQTVFETQAP